MERKNGTHEKNNLWYKDAIIYELHIKAFCDSNGDGIGDFPGLMEKLDYLQDLGVTAIWVLPFYPSPQKDDGYDIADYYKINPHYGTIEQFQQFLAEAHKRNLKVITELVINHTSDQHPWFQKARHAPKGSPERDFYVWSDNPEKYKDVRIIFQDFETSNWTWDPVAQQYFWHRFFHHQPDLNYDSPNVQEEIFKILDYWCAMGVDGFRLDAVPYLYEREGTNGENLPETHVFLKKLRSHIDEYFPGTVFLAEANMWPEDSASYFGDGDECHMNYHFPLMPRMFMALQQEDRYPITDIFDQTPEIPEKCQWAIFLRNHDELTLEMVTDEERDFMYKVYAKDPKARINLGIRHRLAPLMDNDRKRIELMNALLFSLPGTPVVYYGDEIGMGDNFYLGDRDGVRTPMQWSPDRNAGFSSANPHQLYLPVILDPEYSYEAVNVELQRRNTSSLFWFMKRTINMRRNYLAFSRGAMKFIHVENPKVLAFTRSYKDENILVVVNLSKHSQPAEIDLKDFKGYVPVEAFSKNKFPVIKDDSPYFFTLSPHSFQWFTLQRTQTESLAQILPIFELKTWNDLINNSSLQLLEKEILPVYLQNQKWFKGKTRTVYSISIIESLPISFSQCQAFLLLIEVSYETGLADIYQLGVTFLTTQPAKKITDKYLNAVIVNMTIGLEEGILCDAFYVSEFQRFLINKWAQDETSEMKFSGLEFKTGDQVKKHLHKDKYQPEKMSVVDENNTSITYDNKFFLKMFRKVDFSTNPDVEISEYLAEQNKFPYLPSFLGTVKMPSNKGAVVLGMMQDMIENHGDGRTYMLDRVNNFIERILARDRQTLNAAVRMGSLSEPVNFEELPQSLQELLGARAAEQFRLLGARTAEMHHALSFDSHLKEFIAEEFSLHYQRSLFSSMQSLVRETYQNLYKYLGDLPATLKQDIEKLIGRKEDVLNLLKRIYSKKLDVQKIRIHGNYELQKILLTGKDIVVQDFGGNTARSYSERRLKRSPMKDVADMITSIYYVAHEGFFENNHVPKEDINSLLPFADQWAIFMSSFFMDAYLQTLNANLFIPNTKEDREMFIETYLLEKALYHLNYELRYRPTHLSVPLRIILAIIK
jgi:maltose alpha-D-glucosyltransferase/alpha-amylase